MYFRSVLKIPLPLPLWGCTFIDFRAMRPNSFAVQNNETKCKHQILLLDYILFTFSIRCETENLPAEWVNNENTAIFELNLNNWNWRHHQGTWKRGHFAKISIYFLSFCSRNVWLISQDQLQTRDLMSSHTQNFDSQITSRFMNFFYWRKRKWKKYTSVRQTMKVVQCAVTIPCASYRRCVGRKQQKSVRSSLLLDARTRVHLRCATVLIHISQCRSSRCGTQRWIAVSTVSDVYVNRIRSSICSGSQVTFHIYKNMRTNETIQLCHFLAIESNSISVFSYYFKLDDKVIRNDTEARQLTSYWFSLSTRRWMWCLPLVRCNI